MRDDPTASLHFDDALMAALDAAVGQPLFNRAGRRLVLSDMGKVVFGYADEIFSVGAELANLVRGNQTSGPKTLTVGIVSSMPKPSRSMTTVTGSHDWSSRSDTSTTNAADGLGRHTP